MSGSTSSLAQFALTDDQILQAAAAAIQSNTDIVIDLTSGSPMLAWLKSIVSICLWQQSEIYQVLLSERLATCVGAAIDSWVGDFGLVRTPATFATGVQTFGRYSSTKASNIPVGATVLTADGTQTFSVIADGTNPLWSNATNSFVVPAGLSTANIAVQAVTAGIAGNVNANTVTLISSNLSGIDYTYNNYAFVGGSEEQSDASLKAQFVDYINTLPGGTPRAVIYAIKQVQTGLSVELLENVNLSNAVDDGNTVIVVDDGTGSPSLGLLASVEAAADSVRPLGGTFQVTGPNVLTANVSMITVMETGYTKLVVNPLVSAALVSYINALPVGAVLPYSRLAAVAYSVQGVANVESILLNGGTADIGGGVATVVKTSSSNVSIT